MSTTVNAAIPAHEHSVSIDYDFGDDLDKAIELFGAEVVHAKFKQQSTVDLQGAMRRAAVVEEGEGDNKTVSLIDSDGVASELADWKPGISTRTVTSPKEKALALLKKMSPADREAFLASMQEG